jgi:restriction system protein
MKYSFNVNIRHSDRTENVLIEGDDINEVLQKVYQSGYYDKKRLAKDVSDNIRKDVEKETDLLKKSLEMTLHVSWNFLISDFLIKNPEPQKPKLPDEPILLPIPVPPNNEDKKYQPKYGIVNSLIPSRKKSIIDEYEERFKHDYEKWRKEKTRIEELNAKNELEYTSRIDEINKKYKMEYKQWEKARNDVYKKQSLLEQDYIKKGQQGTETYFRMVLMSSDYGDKFFNKKFMIDYSPETMLLLVDYFLPDKKDIKKVKEIKYITARDEFQEVTLSDAELNKKYDITLYEITLRTLNEIFSSDYADSVSQVIFNGWVNTIAPATGQNISPCILSISVTKEKFLALNLKEINPKECFRGLKGISATNLHSITPIPPIMKIEKNDKRFIDSYSVTNEVNHETNLAAMDWEDFEHLIREIFEKEFSLNGGEVKVTQASRDGGVDAIAFDPDPIRGGKIVIQAKRYTNVVGVAAVRDLYGTIVNEGATKGILVTTSNYGSDAYEFAKGKPITLLNGANLLHLLEKHGHKAKIDLQEAKKIFLQREKESN